MYVITVDASDESRSQKDMQVKDLSLEEKSINLKFTSKNHTQWHYCKFSLYMQY